MSSNPTPTGSGSWSCCGFQRLQAGLTRLGALAAFQVATDGGTNTTDDVDNGSTVAGVRSQWVRSGRSLRVLCLLQGDA